MERTAGPAGGDGERRLRESAAQLEQVCALAMALPRRDPGPLRFPPFRSLLR